MLLRLLGLGIDSTELRDDFLGDSVHHLGLHLLGLALLLAPLAFGGLVVVSGLLSFLARVGTLALGLATVLGIVGLDAPEFAIGGNAPAFRLGASHPISTGDAGTLALALGIGQFATLLVPGVLVLTVAALLGVDGSDAGPLLGIGD